MTLCGKGLHDMDAPGGRVRRGRHKSGTVRYSCRLCLDKGGRVNKDKLVCDYGHRFTPGNTIWKLNAQGKSRTRQCRKCKRYRDARAKAKLRGLPVPPPRRRLSRDELEALEAAIRAEEAAMAEIVVSEAADDEGYSQPEPYDPPGWWVLLAACKPGSGVDPEVFYPEDPRDQVALQRARRICAECPVWSECREYAIRREEGYGIWGGMNYDQRERERRRCEPVAS